MAVVLGEAPGGQVLHSTGPGRVEMVQWEWCNDDALGGQ